MPVLFVGHGSPMNAIANNTYTQRLTQLGKELPRPKKILVVSAHWMTQGTWATSMVQPKTIHDFYGFPAELFNVQYPASGAPQLAQELQQILPELGLDETQWGLDHGAWSVLRHLYPTADIPVVQLSLYISQPAPYHFLLGEKLALLREQGVLILGSGNVVHNLRQLQWEPDAVAHPWADEFNQWVLSNLKSRNFASLTNDFRKSTSGQLSVPTMEHYYPMLYILGAAHEEDQLHIDYNEIQNASISMLTFSFR